MTLIAPLADVLRDCLFDALASRPGPLPEERVQIRFGAEVFPDRSRPEDECCPGIAWVRPVETSPRFGVDDFGARCADSLRRSTLEMAVYRCMPTPGVDALVTSAQWRAVFDQAESDHSAMEAALCCFKDLIATGVVPVGDPEITAGEWAPVGPDANCVGSTLQLVIEHGCNCGTDGT
jgi:hypothetical protein